MFIGHFGVALAAKRVAPRTSLGTLVAASSFLDLVWPVLLLAGVERARIVSDAPPFLRFDFESYPISHSALTVLGWALAFGAVYAWRTGYRTGAIVAGALVASHWVLDLAVHVPDLPLWPGGPREGLGLWRSTGATLAVELVLFLAGLGVYVQATRARSRAGTWGLAGFVALLLASYASSLLSPAPPSIGAVGLVGLAGGAIFVAWAAWTDHGRVPRAAADRLDRALLPRP